MSSILKSRTQLAAFGLATRRPDVEIHDAPTADTRPRMIVNRSALAADWHCTGPGRAIARCVGLPHDAIRFVFVTEGRTLPPAAMAAGAAPGSAPDSRSRTPHPS